MSEEIDPFEGLDDLNFDAIEFETLVKPMVPIVVPLFKAFRAEGLSAHEAATMVWTILMTQVPKGE